MGDTCSPLTLSAGDERPCVSLSFILTSSLSLLILAQVMAVDAWLWALGLLTGPVWVNSVGLICTLQSRPISGSLYKEGNVIIGGLFPVHFHAPDPDQMFTQRVQGARCLK